MTNTSTHRQSPQWFSRLHANGRPPLPQLLTQQALGTAYNGNGRLPLMPTISLFNNKGGVGKTTFLFHVAHVLADQGRSVLMVDCDSQCNLTAYALQDKAIEKAWEDGGNSIYRAIELVARGIGDIRNRAPSLLRSNLALIPGALNRAALGGSDYVIVPVAPDLFSIRGAENLGNKLAKWRKEWDQCNAAWSGALEIPKGRPSFLGYVMQQHNIRSNASGMTKGWQIFGNRLESAIQEYIVDLLTPLGQVKNNTSNSFDLGKIPNLHSLIPYSLEARKPVFECTGSDGLTGAHIQRARDSKALFAPIASAIQNVIQ